MLTLPPSVRVFVYLGPADMRRSFDGLAAITRYLIGQDPLSGHLFVFFNRRRDRVKVLFWDRTGLCLWYKRLEEGLFTLPTASDANTAGVELTSADLSLILEGIDLSGATAPNAPSDQVEISTHIGDDDMGADAEIRRQLRGERSVPVLDSIRERLEAWSIELLPKNPVAQAVAYARGRWAALNRYVEDGRLSIDNNLSERTLRMAAVGRKNWMFFGSEAGGHRAAVIYSLTAGCKLCGVDPFAYLRDAITQTCDPTFESFADLTPLARQAGQQASPQD